MDEKTRSFKERMASLALKAELVRQQVEWQDFERQQDFIPWEWKDMERIAPCTQHKQQITLRLDRDMVKSTVASGVAIRGG